MRRFSRPILGLLVGLFQLSCHQALLVAPSGSTLTIFANPTFIEAHTGVSVISVLVIEPDGSPVRDGTVVQFFTSLGQIQEQGKTNDGVARVNLLADSRSGTATVTAVSGGTTAVPASSGSSGSGSSGSAASTKAVSVTIDIGSALPALVIATANPSRITESRSTHVFANVVDGSGNPVAHVPVIFTVVADPATEWMDSGGTPLYTDSSGRAEDVMRTRRTTSGTARVLVTVPAAGVLTDEVEIAIVR